MRIILIDQPKIIFKIESCPEGQVLYGVNDNQVFCRDAVNQLVVEEFITDGGLFGWYTRRNSGDLYAPPATSNGCPSGYYEGLYLRSGYYYYYYVCVKE